MEQCIWYIIGVSWKFISGKPETNFLEITFQEIELNSTQGIFLTEDAAEIDYVHYGHYADYALYGRF